MAPVTEELGVVVVHLLPLLIDHLLPYGRRLHSLPPLVDLKVDAIVVIRHYLSQFLVPRLGQEGAGRVGTLTFFKVFLFFIVNLVGQSYH